MMQICDVRKKYVTGDLVQTALDGVSLSLRDNEFVAILGPSGSGKTTLLNVIGGLDRYDSGDLIINGISTKKYSDRDWDSYRNHTIGFVFQSYNLIPHQTVLANVELALTISGISPGERKKRAKKALEDVGLGNQLHKRPNQMSGGQMQRVAIARALVNNPDILLADEPTGALDSETSVQIMELLRSVAKDRLVVMVTHNPELAEEYANRIVRVRDGKIIGDTNPFECESDSAPVTHKNMGHSSMSFLTALSLSFNNLRTKLARTLLTAFAGSIGIIGIALIMSLSTGFQMYIDQIQEDTLSNYPLTIQSETADMAAAMMAFGASVQAAQNAAPETVVEQQMISQMFAQIGSNDLASFKSHLESNYDQVNHAINAVKYSYGIKPLIYAEDTENGILQVNPGDLFNRITGNAMMSSYMDSDVFQEMIDNPQMLRSQYDVLKGRWPEHYNEMIVVLTDPNSISDYMAYTLGLKDPKQLYAMIEKVMAGQEPEAPDASMVWNYDDLMGLKLRLVPAHSKFRFNEEYSVWEDMSDDPEYMKQIIAEGEELVIVGIVCPKEGGSSATLSTGIAYLPSLTQHVINVASKSDIVQEQISDPQINVFTGTPFGVEDEDKNQLKFEDMISVDGDMLSSAFGFYINEDTIINLLQQYMKDSAGSVQVDTTAARTAFTNTFIQLANEMLTGYIAQNCDENGYAKIGLSDAASISSGYLSGQSAATMIQTLATTYGISADNFTKVYAPLLQSLITAYVASNLEQDFLPPDLVPEESVPDESEPEASIPEPSVPDASVPEESAPEESVPEETVADDNAQKTEEAVQTAENSAGDTQNPVISIDPQQFYALISQEQVADVVSEFAASPLVTGSASVMGSKMMEPQIYSQLMSKIAQFGNVLMGYVGSSMYVDEEKIAAAFQFEMDEDELRRLMAAMSGSQEEVSATANLKKLGYADTRNPTSISIYMVDFAAKEDVLAFLDAYNADMKSRELEDQIISYTDVTGIMMSSVRTIIDSVSYVLIAFVAVSLIVSSIMIGIITYISVMERTKEIGVLRAMGASKRNISQVFNAETFIIGLCSGLIGVGITLMLNYPINMIIHHLTDNAAINAQLPAVSALILVLLRQTWFALLPVCLLPVWCPLLPASLCLLQAVLSSRSVTPLATPT